LKVLLDPVRDADFLNVSFNEELKVELYRKFKWYQSAYPLMRN